MKQLDKHVYGPWALVTGASSGIGEEFARQAAANGINVVLLARREERLKEIAAALTARYDVQARVVAVDLGRDGILDPVTEATDDLDIGLVVSNAGAGNPGPFISLPHQRLREIVQLNVITHLDLAHHFGQRLAKRGRGGIVLVSAVAAAAGLPYMANDVTVLVPVLVNTPVVARIGLDKLGLPAEAISTDQAVDEALTSLLANQVSTLTRTHMTAAFEDMKGAVVEMIQARLAASQPAH